MSGVETLRAQVRWLAWAIAAAVVLMFVVVAVPWLMRMIEVDLRALAWTLTAFAACHAALIIAADRINSATVMQRLLHAVPLAGSVFMALLWHYGGGIGHPGLALAMVLPVIAAGALPRKTFALDVAAYSIAGVVILLTITSPDFGWYLTQLGLPAAALARITVEQFAAPDPFPGATTTPAGAFLFVATFAAIQLAAAYITMHVAKFTRTRDDIASHLEAENEALAAAAIGAAPAVAVSVIAATGQIVFATRRFVQQMLLHGEAVVGRELGAILTFGDANAVRDALAGGGDLPFCRYRLGAEERIASLHATRFDHGGVAYTSVVLTDRGADGWLVAAAAALPEPLLLIDGDGRLRYANDAAHALFDELYVGREMTPYLGDWWRQRDASTETLEIAGRPFDAKATPLPLFASQSVLVTLVRAEGRS
ncbi:MAG TPA: PAS domain-containing protein [Thermoanaerobaculia bacterium]|nr:PAS domain-containing protein [Thermoanaerobaculia bacterium]